MAIVDQFGSPVIAPQRFAHAADRSTFRGPQFYGNDRPLDELIPSHDRKTLVTLSKRLFVNMGAPMRAAIRQKATYSVGNAWLPTYHGSDHEVGAEWAGWLKNVFYPLADVRGGIHDWNALLSLVSMAIDRDGEAFVMLTESKEGFPRVQLIPSFMVCSRYEDKKVKSGPYRGLRLIDGIIYNKQKAPVAYRLQLAKDKFKDISARDMVHVYDPTFQEQGRGLPAFTHALEDMKHMLQSTEYERIKQAVISSILLVEKNELGGPDPFDPANALSADTTNEHGVVQQRMGPGVHYFRANSGSGLDTVKHDSPGDVWESFHDRLIRSAIAPVWSYSLAWKPTGQGTAERGEVEKARRYVVERQCQLKYLARRIVTYAVAKESDRSGNAMPGNMLKWDFTLPPRLTVDDGRENVSLLKQLENDALTMAEYQGFKGRTEEQHYMEKWRGKALDMQIRDQVSKETGQDLAGATAEN